MQFEKMQIRAEQLCVIIKLKVGFSLNLYWIWLVEFGFAAEADFFQWREYFIFRCNANMFYSIIAFSK